MRDQNIKVGLVCAVEWDSVEGLKEKTAESHVLSETVVNTRGSRSREMKEKTDERFSLPPLRLGCRSCLNAHHSVQRTQQRPLFQSGETQEGKRAGGEKRSKVQH